MSNAETPAPNSGGTTAASTAGMLADLPDRPRVHALAKSLGISSREVLAKLAELGVPARSPHSGVSKDVALQVAEAFGVIEQVTGETPVPDGEPEPPEATEVTGAAEVTKAAGTTEEPGTPIPAAGATEQTSAPDGHTELTEEPPAPNGRVRAAAREDAAEASPPAAQEPQATQRPSSPGPVHTPVFAAPSPVFLPPEPVAGRPQVEPEATEPEATEQPERATEETDNGDGDAGGRRRRRRGRRGRGRGKGADDTHTEEQQDQDTSTAPESEDKTAQAEAAPKAGGETPAHPAKPEESGDADEAESSSKRRRRRRRRKGGDEDGAESTTADTADDPPNTVVHVREGKAESKDDTKGDSRDGVRSVRGSTRLEAKRQRRRDGREAGRRRAPILSESEFLARRESVERTMVVAERGDVTQMGVLEDGVLVEHFVTSAGSGSIVGNVYLGRVQNVLPSMEAAFIDIGRGRNAVLYAGEVDWDAAGLEGKARKIEQALSTGDNVLVQVTKDPVGHKGARLTTQISLPGRFLVYVPAGGATGISRKLPENERRRLKDILKRIVPDHAGVIIRTASEGISEDELARDVRRLEAQWEVIQEKADTAGSKKNGAPVLLYEEPDLLVKVVRDLFTEDFAGLEVQGNTAWETIHAYVQHVAPDLVDRLKRYVGTGDVFADHRIDEQIAKALDRKVWLPSGGYLVIDRTEAMTVIDVNTGKFTGSGGNLEETVTRNNLESAEEIVRQLRLRDIGGIIVIDFIDMVLESNRELVLRRLTECLGRDRTRHQVAEVTSLGLVQMTRKRVGTGLLEAFSTTCEHCKGRGVNISTEPQRHNGGGGGGGGGGHQHTRRTRGKGKNDHHENRAAEKTPPAPTPEQRESVVSAVQAMANASKAAADRTGEAEPGDDETPQSVNGRQPDTQPAAETVAVAATAAPAAEAPADQPEQDRQEQDHREPVEPDHAEPQQAQPGRGHREEPEQSEQSEQPEVVPVPAPATRATTRRPRRAATRPAGPPVHAQEHG